jgi:hypothetical protein
MCCFALVSCAFLQVDIVTLVNNQLLPQDQDAGPQQSQLLDQTTGAVPDDLTRA